MPERAVAIREVKRVPRPDPRPRERREPSVRFFMRASADPPPTARNKEKEKQKPVVTLGSEHLHSLPDDTEVRIRRLIAEELKPPAVPVPAVVERTASTARSQMPAPRVNLRNLAVGAAAFALVWNIAIGAHHIYVQARSSAALETTSAVAVAPIPPASGPTHQCAASGAHVLSRSVLVRGGVEAVSSDNRIGLGVVKGAREGVAMELEPASATVKASTKVIAADPLLRVLPAIEADTPLDATAEVGPLHTVGGAGDEGESFETGVQGGFLTWKSHDVVSRLWPMTADVEAPRAVRTGGDRVIVFRRGDAIWMGSVQVDHDAVHPGALAKVSEPAAQVGAPSIDARGDTAVVTWTQRDSRNGKWTVRWTHWRHGARLGPVLQVMPASAGDNAIAPTVAALADGRFLLAWTEGGNAHHRVRAQLYSANDQPMGLTFDVSSAGSDAGQARLAIGADGRGAAGYLVARGNAFDLAAASIACR